MELLARLQEEMKAALKAGNKERLGVIRMLMSDVKIIDMAPKPTTAEQAVEAYVKKLKKSLEEYEKIGRTVEADTLKREIVIAEEFVPKKASAQETEALVLAFLGDQAYTEKQAGQAMGAFLKIHGSRVDAALVNAAMRKHLAGK